MRVRVHVRSFFRMLTHISVNFTIVVFIYFMLYNWSIELVGRIIFFSIFFWGDGYLGGHTFKTA